MKNEEIRWSKGGKKEKNGNGKRTTSNDIYKSCEKKLFSDERKNFQAKRIIKDVKEKFKMNDDEEKAEKNKCQKKKKELKKERIITNRNHKEGKVKGYKRKKEAR